VCLVDALSWVATLRMSIRSLSDGNQMNVLGLYKMFGLNKLL
jgi:hypothetical protein